MRTRRLIRSKAYGLRKRRAALHAAFLRPDPPNRVIKAAIAESKRLEKDGE